MMNRFLILAITLMAGFLAPSARAEVEVLDEVIAIVDEDVILKSELDQRMQAVKAQFRDNPEARLPPDDVLKEQIVERLIIESLQLQMAERAGVRVSDEELNSTMRTIAERNNLTLAQFQEAIQQDGMSWREMRSQIRREMMISRVQQGVMNNRIQITPREINNFLKSELGEVITADEYRLAHILLPIPDDANSDQIRDVRREAEKTIQRIKEGADFQSLAVEKSAGQNALEGGDLGWRKAVQLPTIFSDVVPEMEIGEVRGPIKSGSGYHLIKLLRKRGAEAEGQVEQTRVRHVLIQPTEIRAAEEARELAEALRQEVIEGRSFDEVAKLYSDDPGSALSGGDLGWNRSGTFVPEFENMMNNTRVDEISPVFRSDHGFHFLEVTGRRVEDFSERFRMSQAENYLRNQKFDEELQTWIQEIREDAFVEIRI